MALSWPLGRRRPAASAWAGSSHAESSLAQLAWERRHRAAARWGWAGLLCGALAALVVFAPATWLAEAVATGTNQRLLLTDARGTVWNGSAVPVLAGGGDSRSAAMLPGRAGWRVGLRGTAIELRLSQDCCINGELPLLLRPGLGRLTVELPAGRGEIGAWPAAWLAGLGAPFNTLQPTGTLRLGSPGMSLQFAAGRWQLAGQAELQLDDLATPLAPLEQLGSYRLRIDGSGPVPAFTLSTAEGALLLEGSGQWTGSQLRFRGNARAAPGFEGELDNLLNFMGRRQGALSLLSIG
jgi:general secretion pathway protein N